MPEHLKADLITYYQQLGQNQQPYNWIGQTWPQYTLTSNAGSVSAQSYSAQSLLANR